MPAVLSAKFKISGYTVYAMDVTTNGKSSKVNYECLVHVSISESPLAVGGLADEQAA